MEGHLKQKGDQFTIEVKQLSSLYTVDLIATIAFGIETSSIANPKGKFNTITRSFFGTSWRQSLSFSIAFLLPHLVNVLRIKLVSDLLTSFIRSTLQDIMKERQLTQKERGDLIDVLIQLKQELSPHGETSDDAIFAQGFNFLIAGYETSATTMSFALFEIAKHPAVQESLKNEIRDAIESGEELTYDKINSLDYMNMVVDEILRLYPILGFLDRQHNCEKDKEAFSLRPHHDFVLPDGMPVYIPVFAIHRDPKVCSWIFKHSFVAQNGAS